MRVLATFVFEIIFALVVHYLTRDSMNSYSMTYILGAIAGVIGYEILDGGKDSSD